MGIDKKIEENTNKCDLLEDSSKFNTFIFNCSDVFIEESDDVQKNQEQNACEIIKKEKNLDCEISKVKQNENINEVISKNHFKQGNETPENLDNTKIKSNFLFKEFDSNKNITFPNHVTEINHIGMDVGGTLTKIIYFKIDKLIGNKKNGGKLYFKKIETEKFEQDVLSFIVDFIIKSLNSELYHPIKYLMITGGGGLKFYQIIKNTFEKKLLKVKIIVLDEMDCLVKGLNWLVTTVPNEVFEYDLVKRSRKISKTIFDHKKLYPYLLVNIGTGVSMIKVLNNNIQEIERVGGTSLGGGTLWGLMSLLTNCKSYYELLKMIEEGNNENIDLLVGDIYGTDYSKIGLKKNIIASSFAKIFKKISANLSNVKELAYSDKISYFKQQDLAKSFHCLITNNIGHLAFLEASRCNLKKIYFSGSYISGHSLTISKLSQAVNFWSKGSITSYFLQHESHLGCVGALITDPNYKLFLDNVRI